MTDLPRGSILLRQPLAGHCVGGGRDVKKTDSFLNKYYDLTYAEFYNKYFLKKKYFNNFIENIEKKEKKKKILKIILIILIKLNIWL